MEGLRSAEERLRHECLKLAVSADRGVDPIKDAKRFFAFIKGEDKKMPRECMPQAREGASVR